MLEMPLYFRLTRPLRGRTILAHFSGLKVTFVEAFTATVLGTSRATFEEANLATLEWLKKLLFKSLKCHYS